MINNEPLELVLDHKHTYVFCMVTVQLFQGYISQI